jgi:hypothetical protein
MDKVIPQSRPLSVASTALSLYYLLHSLLTSPHLTSLPLTFPPLPSPALITTVPAPSLLYQCTEDLSRALSTGVGTNLQHFSTMPESFTQVGARDAVPACLILPSNLTLRDLAVTLRSTSSCPTNADTDVSHVLDTVANMSASLA